MQYILDALKEEILKYLPAQNRFHTDIPGFILTRFDSMTVPMNCLYYPLIALVIQGCKRAFYGAKEVCYGRGQYVALASDMPGIYHVTDASPDNPFLSLSIGIDTRVIASLMAEYDIKPLGGHECDAPIGVETADEDMLLAFYRLLRLQENRDRIATFAPMIKREIHYYLLMGNLGGKLGLFSTPGTRGHRITQSIAYLRKHFREQLTMEELARLCNMAPSTFNKYFKEATSVSPLQFQKRLRLYEAQRLILMENMDARAAASAVGYESESQFSREYKRLFGLPPIRDLSCRH